MSYALVIGEKNGRKSAAMREIADALVRRGLRVGGFTQRIFEEGPGRKVVDLVRLRGAMTLRLAHTTTEPGSAAAVCSFAFDAAAFDEARRWIDSSTPSPARWSLTRAARRWEACPARRGSPPRRRRAVAATPA